MENKEQNKSRGLGDTIEKITTATGIKTIVDTVAKVTGKGCGCAARKEALNNKFPYKERGSWLSERFRY
jgi:hypothetical protein